MLKTNAVKTKNTLIILLSFCLSTTYLLAQKRMNILDRDTLYFKSAGGFLVPSDSSDAEGYGLVDSFNLKVHTKKIMYVGTNQTMIEYECYDVDYPNIDAVAMPVFSVRHGKYSEWYENGEKRVNGSYSNDKIEYFNKVGNNTSIHYYYYKSYRPLEGFSQISKFISTELKYPKFARSKKIEGTVYVEFVVNTDGAFYDIRIEKGVEKHLDEEAIRIIKAMPHWRPSLYATVSMRFKFILPIKFSLK